MDKHMKTISIKHFVALVILSMWIIVLHVLSVWVAAPDWKRVVVAQNSLLECFPVSAFVWALLYLRANVGNVAGAGHYICAPWTMVCLLVHCLCCALLLESIALYTRCLPITSPGVYRALCIATGCFTFLVQVLTAFLLRKSINPKFTDENARKADE
jgi:hypothetical protein